MTFSMVKDPDATVDRQIDWSDWLTDLADTITSSTWILPTGITGANMSHTTTSATIWLSSGTAGQSYTVTNRVVTAGGRTDDRSIEVFVTDR